MNNSSENPRVVWHTANVTAADRERLSGHRGGVLWFTGLSGSGKSTIANAVESLLAARRVRTMLLDGDNVRHGLCATPQLLEPTYGEAFARRFGLGFSAEDRQENIRRVGSVCSLMAEAGMMVLTAFVSPYRRDRDLVRAEVERLGPGRFAEVFVDTPLAVCEARDPKGLYREARAGRIKNFTGIDDPYESPTQAELTLPGGSEAVESLARRVVDWLDRAGWFGDI